MTEIIILIVAYLIGAIPFGLIVSNISGIKDIRNAGSGNIGATNVLRVGNKKLAAITLLLDVLKGFLVILVTKYISNSDMHYAALVSFCVIVGHIFPIYINFKGGKGVATFLGVMLALNLYSALVFLAIWILVFVIFRYSSLASIVAMIMSTSCLVLFYHENLFMPFTIINLLIIIKHSKNLFRLIKGEEYRFSFKNRVK